MGPTDLDTRLRSEGLRSDRWSNGSNARYAAHAHPYDKVIVCVAGAIVFGLPDDRAPIGLGAGDRLELPAGTTHDALVGDEGVTCLEAHLPAGRLASLRHRPTGSW